MSTQTANTILQQLGGNQFMAMTGSKKPTALDGGNTLYLKLSRNKSGANVLRVTLTPADTYTVDFRFERMASAKDVILHNKKDVSRSVKCLDDIYWDQLQDIFEDVTGLYVTLNARR